MSKRIEDSGLGVKLVVEIDGLLLFQGHFVDKWLAGRFCFDNFGV